MDLEFLVLLAFSLVFPLVVLAMIGGFRLLKPLTRQLGAYLQKRIDEGEARRPPEEWQAAVRAIRELRHDVEALTERQEFVEQLLEERSRDALRAGDREESGEEG